MFSNMKSTIKTSYGNSITIFKPEICPHCQKGMDAKVINHFTFNDVGGVSVEVVCLQCPICGKLFFCSYTFENYGANAYPIPYREIIGGDFLEEVFPKEIFEVSPRFVNIYNQAYKAEQAGLDEIMGIGYRKAFEFLIKDFGIFLKPDDSEKISSMLLGDSIKYIFDENERAIMEKTGWIGNDETHYEKKHPAFDCADLKAMIKICVSKIETRIKEINYLKSFESEEGK